MAAGRIYSRRLFDYDAVDMKSINRRAFVRSALQTVAVASAGGAGLLLRGCSKGRDLDLVIAGGTVYDGSGGPPFRGDVGISGGTIRALGRVARSRAGAVIEADGLAVSPGFIDVHDHTDTNILVNPKAESAVRQGVTTLVCGQCGGSPFPVTESTFEERTDRSAQDRGFDLDWREIKGFLAHVERAGAALNFATFVGHGSVRAAAMGFDVRPASAAELEKMKALVAEAMAGGALGLSSGLEYTPGSFAPTEELIELSRVAAAAGGVYATHMRNEDVAVLEAVDEALRIAREAGIRLQISHLKICHAAYWSKIDALMAKLEEARASGIDLRCDRYPYIAGATTLALLFPLWAREGTNKDFIDRLGAPALDARLRSALADKEKLLGSWDKVLITQVGTDKNRVLEGMNVLEASSRAGKRPYEFIRDLLIEENGQVDMVDFYGNEDILKRILSQPYIGVGGDGEAVAPYGLLSKGRPHPRYYGTFPRVLGRYIREEKILPLEEMIRKMTAMPAAHLGFVRRGELKVGWAADVCVFDPQRVIDKATFKEPAVYPEGVRKVIVNGRVVVDDGTHTGTLAGKVLRKNAHGAVA